MNDNPQSVYFIGIGGIGMSAAAGMAKELGWDVAGSDSKTIYDPAKGVLDKYFIDYHIGYDAEHFRAQTYDVYVASAGEDLSNPEVAFLRSQGIPLKSLSEFLYELHQDVLRVMVSGTHGKSTTTAMLGTILQTIDDSSFVAGAVLQHSGSNFHVGNGHYFVVEGDEYKALFDDPTPKFQQYQPDITLLTNLEFDHPDVFASLDELKQEFALLLQRMPDDGLIAYNADSVALAELVHGTNIGSVSFGLHNPADYMASNIEYRPTGTSFDVVSRPENATETIERYTTQLYGEMNVYNALGVIALLRTLGFSADQIQTGLDRFQGIKRRLELKNLSGGIRVYDDYAHHPTAVAEAIASLRQTFPESRIWAVFEPHTYSRTMATLTELTKAFADADQVIIAEIYPAREQRSLANISGQDVVDAVTQEHSAVQYAADRSAALALLEPHLTAGDVVLVMAVGNFNLLADDLAAKLQDHGS